MYGTPGIPFVGGGQSGPPPVPMQAPTNLFRYGEQSLWSSYRWAAGAALASTTNRLFSTPLGQQGQGFGQALSIAETNLKEGGRIPTGVAYDVFGVGLHLMAEAGSVLAQPINNDGVISDLVNVQNNAVLTWDFTQTQVDVAPVHMIGAGGGIYGSVSIAPSNPGANAETGNMNNGAGSLWLYRKHPVALPGSSQFGMLLRFGSAANTVGGQAGMTLKVSLLGYYKNLIEIG